MASTRDLWEKSFPDDEIPAFPCPGCDRGNLLYVKDSLHMETSEVVSLAHQRGDIELFEAPSVFSLFLRCSVGQCGCIVNVHGSAMLSKRSHWRDDDEQYFYTLTPHGMLPAPPLATVPPETPLEVSKEIGVACQLFWVDLGSCANRLRISVERVLDVMGAPPGKLYNRINDFKENDPDNANTFDALRHVGNLGSHEGVVERTAILDAFEVYQHALAEIFGAKSVKIEAMKQRLIQSKGKY